MADIIYRARGTLDDFAYEKYGIYTWTFELAYGPDPDPLKEMLRVNIPGLIRLLTEAPAVRSKNHKFEGHCESQEKSLDTHNE